MSGSIKMPVFGVRTSPKTGFDKMWWSGKTPFKMARVCSGSEAMVIGMCHKGENVRYSFFGLCRDVCCCASGDVGILEEC